MPLKTAILILNFNGKRHLDTCFKSVLRQTRSTDQVYLVDNNSTDDSIEHTREKFPSVRIIESDRNFGFAEAYNRAAVEVDADVLVFLNNDVEVASHWLRELVTFLEGDDNPVAICGSKIFFYSAREVVNHAGGRLVPLGGGIDLDFLKVDDGRPREPELVGCVSGASMAVRRPVFFELGGFDSDFFAYFEDVDLCWRAWLAGYRVLVNPRSRLYHKVGGTWGSFMKSERVYLGERNRVQCLLKNCESGRTGTALFVSLIFDAVRTVEFLTLGSGEHVRSIARAHWWNLRNLRRVLMKRGRIQSNRKVHDDFLVRQRLMTTYSEGLREYLRLALLRRKYSEVFWSPEKSLKLHSTFFRR